MAQNESGQEDSPEGMSRRDALKRGVVLGGAALWVVPAVQVLSLTEAAAAQPSGIPAGRPGNADPRGPAQGRRFGG